MNVLIQGVCCSTIATLKPSVTTLMVGSTAHVAPALLEPEFFVKKVGSKGREVCEVLQNVIFLKNRVKVASKAHYHQGTARFTALSWHVMFVRGFHMA